MNNDGHQPDRPKSDYSRPAQIGSANADTAAADRLLTFRKEIAAALSDACADKVEARGSAFRFPARTVERMEALFASANRRGILIEKALVVLKEEWTLTSGNGGIRPELRAHALDQLISSSIEAYFEPPRAD